MTWQQYLIGVTISVIFVAVISIVNYKYYKRKVDTVFNILKQHFSEEELKVYKEQIKYFLIHYDIDNEETVEDFVLKLKNKEISTI